MDFLKKPVVVGVAVVILLTSLIGTGFYLSRKGNGDIERPSSVRVEVEQVRRGSLTRETTVVGRLESNSFVTMKAQVRGLISKVHVVGGESVDKGDLLFEIDDRVYKAKVKEAQALLTLSESAFEREQKLAEKNFGTAKKLEEARAQFLKAQAQLESAQKDLDDTKIRAPFEGVVGLHKISEGTPITGDLDLITITDLDPMKVNFKMPSKFIPYLSLDQKVTVEADTYPGQKFEGRIEAIDAQIDVGAQSIAVQATIPNLNNLLKPGMFVRVKVVVGSKDNSLIVPEEAVVASGDQTYVWQVIEVPDKPGVYVAIRRQILTGIQERDRVEVVKPLREGDIVITIGHQKVQQGIPVSFDLRSIGIEPKEEPQKDQDKKEEKDGDKKAQIIGPSVTPPAASKDESQKEAASKEDKKVLPVAANTPKTKRVVQKTPERKPRYLSKGNQNLRSLLSNSTTRSTN